MHFLSDALYSAYLTRAPDHVTCAYRVQKDIFVITEHDYPIHYLSGSCIRYKGGP